MAANPFLFTEETYTSPNSTNSNPFLLGDDDVESNTGYSDNPFLSQTATTISTNPFSFDPMDLEPAEAEIPQISQLNAPLDPFGILSEDSSLSTSNDTPFSSMEPITTQPVMNDFMNYTKNETTTSPQKPSDLDLKYSHSKPGQCPPRPPPRVPPSKETQDLLMSVMGAMDATSSTLLDKIPPTRTPSPVSMRDLHSPCPTPEPTLGDLLDVSDKIESSNTTSSKDIFSLEQDNICDINQNPTFNITKEIKQPQKVIPPRPAPPVRPPRPPLPSAPIHTISSQNNPTMVIEKRVEAQIPDEMDMFGVEAPQKPVTKADILNLYNTPKQEPVKDLLCDEETDIIMQPPNDNSTPMIISNTVKEEKNDTVSSFANDNIIRDNLISPEFNQDDLQMDLSESHSRESVCSVTLNPFAMPEEVAPTAVVSNQHQEKMNIFDSAADEVFQNDSVKQDEFSISVNTAAASQDAFSFSQPINTVSSTNDVFGFGEPTTMGGNTQDAFGFGATVEISNKSEVAFTINDDFDEFSRKFDSVKTDGAKTSDIWGNETVNTSDGLSGFGQEEGFDAFLALQEPPCVPQSTPNRISKSGSQESDEDKDFSVFIRFV